MSDFFKFVVPATLEKAKDGEWKVRGLASTGKIDQQGETIIQKGVDLSPIDKKRGVLNWDHQKGPENTIGVLDGYNRTQNGLYIEGRLFKNHSKAKAVREIMESLGEGDRGRMGLSVEGRILERDPMNPAVIRKCQINAVALTMNPVNTDTFADIVKSMNASQEVEFDAQESTVIDDKSDEPVFTATQVLTIVQKALGISAGAAGAPNTLAGGNAMTQEDFEHAGKKKKKKEPVHVEKGGPGSGPKAGQSETEKTNAKIGELISTPRRMARRRNLKAMSKNMYKANLTLILDRLQTLYPNFTRSEIWKAVKGRLDTRFPAEEQG